MAISYQTASVAFSGGSWSLSTPSVTGVSSQLIGVQVKPANLTISTPTGHTLLFTITGNSSKIQVFAASFVSDRAAGTVTGTTKNAANANTGEGEAFLIAGNFSVVDHVTSSVMSYSTTFTAPAGTADNAGAVIALFASDQYPRSYTLSGLTELVDVYAGFGPSLAFGHVNVSAGAVGPYTATPADPYNPSNAGGDLYLSATLILEEMTEAVPGSPTVSGGGIIPVVQVQTVSVVAPATLDVAASATVTVTVTGSDGLPFSNSIVNFSAGSNVTLSATSGTTNASGVVTVNISGAFAGSAQVSASIGGKTGTDTVVVTASAATIVVSMVADLSTVVEGGVITFSGFVKTGADVPQADKIVVFSITGAPWVPITQGVVRTNGTGAFSYQIQPTSDGLLTAQAESESVFSPPVLVTVQDDGSIVDPESEIVRLRLADYGRTKPVKR